MEPLTALSLIGFLLGLSLMVIGGRQLWSWIATGYALEARHLALGRDCLKVAEEVVEGDKVLPMRRPV